MAGAVEYMRAVEWNKARYAAKKTPAYSYPPLPPVEGDMLMLPSPGNTHLKNAHANRLLHVPGAKDYGMDFIGMGKGIMGSRKQLHIAQALMGGHLNVDDQADMYSKIGAFPGHLAEEYLGEKSGDPASFLAGHHASISSMVDALTLQHAQQGRLSNASAQQLILGRTQLKVLGAMMGDPGGSMQAAIKAHHAGKPDWIQPLDTPYPPPPAMDEIAQEAPAPSQSIADYIQATTDFSSLKHLSKYPAGATPRWRQLNKQVRSFLPHRKSRGSSVSSEGVPEEPDDIKEALDASNAAMPVDSSPTSSPPPPSLPYDPRGHYAFAVHQGIISALHLNGSFDQNDVANGVQHKRDWYQQYMGEARVYGSLKKKVEQVGGMPEGYLTEDFWKNPFAYERPWETKYEPGMEHRVPTSKTSTATSIASGSPTNQSPPPPIPSTYAAPFVTPMPAHMAELKERLDAAKAGKLALDPGQIASMERSYTVLKKGYDDAGVSFSPPTTPPFAPPTSSSSSSGGKTPTMHVTTDSVTIASKDGGGFSFVGKALGALGGLFGGGGGGGVAHPEVEQHPQQVGLMWSMACRCLLAHTIKLNSKATLLAVVQQQPSFRLSSVAGGIIKVATLVVVVDASQACNQSLAMAMVISPWDGICPVSVETSRPLASRPGKRRRVRLRRVVTTAGIPCRCPTMHQARMARCFLALRLMHQVNLSR